MPLAIEDYALIGDTRTAALVGRDGSIDWMCVPRFDSGACFAALLGVPEHGRWQLAPSGEVCGIERRYRDGTLVLETDFETAERRRPSDGLHAVAEGRSEIARMVDGLQAGTPRPSARPGRSMSPARSPTPSVGGATGRNAARPAARGGPWSSGR